MPKFSDDDLIDMFGDRTYERGLDYYQNGNVSDPMVLDGVLYAEVWGSAEEPYETSVTIEERDVFSDCTCPVGDMCKHGVAVLLTWMKDPSSFMDGDMAVKSLEGKSKEELLKIIKKLLSRHRGLFREIGVSGKAKTKSIDYIVKGIKRTFDSDYYNGYNLARRLATFKDQADVLAENGRYEDAANVYLKIVESCFEIYEEAEDEGEDLSSFIIECSGAFEETAGELGDESRDKLIDAVLGLFWRDDWDMGTEGMLSALITTNNVDSVRQRVVRDIKCGRDSYISHIRKDDVINLLGNIYKSYGKPEEKIRIAEECLIDKDDYARLAQAIMETGDPEGAFVAVIRGLTLEQGTSPSGLNELYFDLAARLIKSKPEMVDHRTALIPALDIMSGWFDPEKYATISSIYKRLGKLDELHDVLIRCIKNRDTVILALIHDGNVKVAVELAARTQNLHSGVLFKVARAAKQKGMPDEAASLLRASYSGIKRFWEADIPPDDLIGLMVSRSDTPSLKEVCDNIVKNKTSGFGAKMIPALAKKSPDLASRLLKEFYYNMSAGSVADASRIIAVKLPEQMMAICMSKINRDCLSSHVHYDEAVLLLKALRDIYELSGKKSEWPVAIKQFSSDNKGKKKLIDKLEAAFGADLKDYIT